MFAALLASVCCQPIRQNRLALAKSDELQISPKLAELRQKAYKLFINKDFEAAIPVYAEARRIASAEGNLRLSVQFLNNIAGCHHSLYQYREAVQYYQAAIQESRAANLKGMESVAALNLSSIHLTMGENLKAADSIALIPRDGSTFNPDSRLDSFLQMASVYTRLENDKEASDAFERASVEADLDVPSELVKALQANRARWSESLRESRRAWVYSVRGECLNWRKKFAEAEPYVLDAFRIRATYRQQSYPRNALQLAMIARSRGDFDSARKLLQVAHNLDPGNRTPMHRFLLSREEAKIELESGNFSAALGPLRAALSLARSWRMEVLPSDSTFLSFESYLNSELQGKFLNAMAQPLFTLTPKGLAEESFWIAEEARFAAMRAAQFPAEEFLHRLPKDYWSLLAKMQNLQTSIATGRSGTPEELASVERQLNSLEVEAGLSVPHSANSSLLDLQEWRRAIPPDEAIFSYYLAEPYSLAWVADRNGIQIRRIAGRQQLKTWTERFRADIDNGTQIETSSTGMELTKQLFGDYLYSHRTITFWTMVIDQELATLPFAALPTGGKQSHFLVEDHTMRTLPSAIHLRPTKVQDWTRRAVGIADPIYNGIDQRTGGTRPDANLLQLNRLAASAREMQESLAVMNKRNWSTHGWTGAAANAMNLRAELQGSPDIVHISTHFIGNEANSRLLSIALTPDAAGHALFSALDLNSLRTNSKLIVLSGCNSSSGAAVSGIAVNGLARACLIAGTDTVVATLWPTIDSNGPIFPVFYNNLLSRKWSARAAAMALREAQLQMIRQGGWTSRPAYWAAYLAISKG